MYYFNVNAYLLKYKANTNDETAVKNSSISYLNMYLFPTIRSNIKPEIAATHPEIPNDTKSISKGSYALIFTTNHPEKDLSLLQTYIPHMYNLSHQTHVSICIRQ
jgi:hypothetical protein